MGHGLLTDDYSQWEATGYFKAGSTMIRFEGWKDHSGDRQCGAEIGGAGRVKREGHIEGDSKEVLVMVQGEMVRVSGAGWWQ